MGYWIQLSTVFLTISVRMSVGADVCMISTDAASSLCVLGTPVGWVQGHLVPQRTQLDYRGISRPPGQHCVTAYTSQARVVLISRLPSLDLVSSKNIAVISVSHHDAQVWEPPYQTRTCTSATTGCYIICLSASVSDI